MGTILVVENDPIFGAVLEDRLQVAGHTVEVLSDRERAMAVAAAAPKDLVIYGMDGSVEDGLGLVRDLKSRSETQGLPILVLAESRESSERVAALRAGADDYLTKPCDLEELALRTERLVGARAERDPVLHGDLASHPPSELMQYLRQARKSGDLVVKGRSARGRIRVRGGRITAAQCGELPGSEALLAVLGEKEGRFRFLSEDDAGEAGPVHELSSIHEVLLQAAWLEDELDKRRGHLPATGAPLSATGKALPPAGGNDQLAGLPLAEVHEMVLREPQLRVHDLMGRLPRAPQKIRLAIAWLVEQGVLASPAETPAVPYPTTTEITSSLLVDVAVTDFLAAARKAGFSSPALPFLILAEPDVWSVLLDLVENVPGYQTNDPLRSFSEQLRLRRGGSVSFTTDLGKLSLHAQVLKKETRGQIEAVLSACAGVLVWLGEGGGEDLLGNVVDRLEKARGAAKGIVVATRAPARAAAGKLLAGREHWRLSSHAPQSLLGVLRLLRPSEGA